MLPHEKVRHVKGQAHEKAGATLGRAGFEQLNVV